MPPALQVEIPPPRITPRILAARPAKNRVDLEGMGPIPISPTRREMISPASGPLRRAVFLDRDGVINRALTRAGRPYPPRQLQEFEILPGVEEACRQLKQAGLLLVVATNQPDVGRGTLAKEMVEAIHGQMCRILPIDSVRVCFHGGHEQPPCSCRKPLPGMLLQAADELRIDLSESYMVGDRWRDIDCGHAAGSTTFLVDYHYDEPLRVPPDHRVRDLAEAAEIIIGKLAKPGLR